MRITSTALWSILYQTNRVGCKREFFANTERIRSRSIAFYGKTSNTKNNLLLLYYYCIVNISRVIIVYFLWWLLVESIYIFTRGRPEIRSKLKIFDSMNELNVLFYILLYPSFVWLRGIEYLFLFKNILACPFSLFFILSTAHIPSHHISHFGRGIDKFDSNRFD